MGKYRCPKHYWVKETVRAVMNLKLVPGGLNYVWPEFKVEICSRCKKIRNEVINIKEEQWKTQSIT